MAKGDVSPVEAEIFKAYNIKRKEGEDHVDLVRRLAKAVDDGTDDQWESLSQDAQKWLLEATSAAKKGSDVPPFPDVADDGDEDKDDVKSDDAKEAKVTTKTKEKTEKAAKPAKKAKAEKPEKTAVAKVSKAKPAKAKTTKPAKADKTSKKAKSNGAAKPAKKAARKPRSEKSATMRIKELVFGDPGISAADIAAKLKKEGFKAGDSTIASYRADFLHSMRYLKSEGVKGLPALD